MYLLVATLSYFLVVLVIPTLILAIKHGQMPFTFHKKVYNQRIMGILFLVLILSMTGWPILVEFYPDLVWTNDWKLIGSIIGFLGTVITFVAQYQMGASWRVGVDPQVNVLISKGLFKIVRNPIFSGMIITLAGYLLIKPGFISVMIFVSTVVGIFYQVTIEEKQLATHYGSGWSDYSSKVGRFFPGIGKMKSNNSTLKNTDNNDYPMPLIAFRLMCLLFRIRDFFIKPKKVVLNAGVKKGEKIVDFGCGPGTYAIIAAEIVGNDGFVTAIDIVPYAVEKLRDCAKNLSNLSVICSDKNTFLESSSIDRVLAIDVIHMISHKKEVLAELFRVLKPGGILVSSADHMPKFELERLMNDSGMTLESEKGKLLLFRKNLNGNF